MSKINDFLIELEEELLYLKPKDAGEILKFYQDKINVQVDYGDDEDKIIASLPSPKKIAEDVYKSKGKDYLDSRIKRKNKEAKIKAVFYALLVIIIAVGMVSILSFVGICIYQLFRLLFLSLSMSAFIDKLTLFLFIVFYILVLSVAIIYIFDLLYILLSHFLYPILLEISKKKKEYKFLSFTISGFIENKLKKEKILGKIFIGLICGLILFGICNTVSKGYIYRSSSNDLELTEEVKVLGIFEEIDLEESTTFVKVKQDSVTNVTLKYYNEFNKNIEYEVVDKKLIIKKINRISFDIFGFLDEPLSTLEIIIPLNMNVKVLDIHLNSGYLDMADFKKEIDLKLRGTNSTYALTNSYVNNILVEGVNLNIASENNVYKDVDVKIENGKYYSVGDTYNNLNVTNKLANFILQKVKAQDINISASSAKTALDRVDVETITYKDSNSESLLQDIYSKEAVINSVANSDTKLERFVATNKFTLEEQVSNVDLYFVKSTDMKLKLKRGSLDMYYINRNTITTPKESDANYEYTTRYNNYKSLSVIDVITNEVDMEINSSTFECFISKFEFGTLDINNSYIKESSIDFMDTTIQLIDVDGLTMNVNVNGGIFSYDLETITTNNVVTVTGELFKTDIYIADSIKRGDAE